MKTNEVGDQVLSWGFDDDELDEFAWESMTECLSEILKEINPQGVWSAEVKNFGWRNIDGQIQKFETLDGAEFLRTILPQTDCHFKIFRYGKGLAIQNYHHDSPTGNEWYYVLPKGGGEENDRA